MGARANIRVKQSVGDDAYVYLYSHWKGAELAIDLQRALAKRWRWDDDQYLTRIIFDEMIGPDGHGQETGFGISTYEGDNSYPIITVDPKLQVVEIGGGRAIPFAEYLELPPDRLRAMMTGG